MNHLILYVLGFLKFIIENDLHTSTRFSHIFYLLFVNGTELATGSVDSKNLMNFIK